MLHVYVVLYTLSIGKTYVAQDSAEAALSARLSYKCCAVNRLELVCRVPIYWGCVIEVMWSMLQEFGITCACGAVYTEHWKQLLKEFGAA